MKKLILLGGPTASGKTALAIQLAQALDTVILNADSRQFYREMYIGTAVPSPEELAAIPHYFIQTHSVVEPLSAAAFEQEGLSLLKHLFEKYEVIIACGGSGLYLQALAEGLDPLPPANPEYRKKLEQLSADELAALLVEKAPEKAAVTDLKNPRRLIRTLEILEAAGPAKPHATKTPRFFETVALYLDPERDRLYRQIDQRVLNMMEAGFLDEARELYDHRNLTALQTVGYRELFEHLEGKISLEEAVRKIQQHTRNYAKRQLTWFRNKGKYRPVQSIDDALAGIA